MRRDGSGDPVTRAGDICFVADGSGQLPLVAAPASPEHRLRIYRVTGDRAVRNQVVEEHMWLARTIAREFQRGTEPLADLVQVAAMAVVKAAERFDPDFGAAFTSFASVTIRGELRRHYRDHGWTMRVARSLQERRAEVRRAVDFLRARDHRSPTPQTVARYLHLSMDEVIEALYADENYRPVSLESGGDGREVGARLGTSDPGFEAVEADDAFAALVRTCPERLATVLHLRYVERLAQAEIADRIGVSQVHVSRLLARAHELVRANVDASSGANA